ncbi:MAG: protein kinase [Desulfovibrionaceae bacterium]
MKIDRYKILGRLGQGGMGVVYKAEQPLTGRMVALKLCRPADILLDVAGPERVRELFLAEARAMGRVRHPNVAAVLDAGQIEVPGQGRMPYLVMEYFCNNLGLIMGEDYVVEEPSRLLSVPRALHYARQILEGVQRLHFDGLVHRDLKPFNVMLTDEDRAVLIDFGLSKLRGEVREQPRGMVVGSPFYAAPEQEADPEAADERSDLYSVGVTLFRMVTGLLPEGETRAASVLRPELGSQWDAFFVVALARDPAGRFASAKAMREALDELERAWERGRSEACALVEEEPAPVRPGTPRAKALRVGLKQARQVFGLDRLWRPVHHTENDFSEQGHTVLDRATGLVWQLEAGDYPMDHAQAAEYVARLDKTGYAGRNGWRLPTVDELTTLFVDRAAPGAFCLEALFGSDKTRLWSADRKAFTAAWYVDADLGFVWWQDTTCSFYVRAVCSAAHESFAPEASSGNEDE